MLDLRRDRYYNVKMARDARPETEIRASLREWLLNAANHGKKKPKIDPNDLTDQTLILEARVISSLRLMELMQFIEELRGSAVDPASVGFGAFASIDAIYQAFFQDSHVDRI